MIFSNKEKKILKIMSRNIIKCIGAVFVFIASIILGTINGIWNMFKYVKNYLLNGNIRIEDIDKNIKEMNSRQFEYFCSLIFKELGYKVKLTKATNDYGRDLILDENIFVEIKHYDKDKSSMVGREICQKLLGSCKMFDVEKAIIINTGKYHNNAYECAAMVDNLELWDKKELYNHILKLNSDQMYKILFKTKNYNVS